MLHSDSGCLWNEDGKLVQQELAYTADLCANKQKYFPDSRNQSYQREKQRMREFMSLFGANMNLIREEFVRGFEGTTLEDLRLHFHKTKGAPHKYFSSYAVFLGLCKPPRPLSDGEMLLLRQLVKTPTYFSLYHHLRIFLITSLNRPDLLKF